MLLGFATVFLTVGLAMAGQESCQSGCETLALTMLYAGGPISAALGVLFGLVIVAWPLEITFWVVAGFLVTRWAERRARRPLPTGLFLVLAALAYGLVLSLFVEVAVTNG